MLTRLRPYVALPFAALLLFLHARVFWFVTDDAFISFVYSRNLAEHGQLVYNLGERVEGYTNFLWTVLLAGVLRLGGDLERWSLWLATACSIGTLALAIRLSRRLSPEAPEWQHALPPFLLAGCGAFACWTSGGLETALFTLLVTAGLTCAAEDRELPMGGLFSLAAMTRPEGILFFGLAGLWMLVRHRRLPWRAGLLFVAIFAPYFAWRWSYYGWPFPNTYYVKSSGTRGPTLAQGAYYAWQFARDYGIWFLVPLLVPMRGALAPLALTAIFLAYVVSVGGDFMGLYRFLVPLLPVLAISAGRALGKVGMRLPGPVCIALAALYLGSFAWQSVRVTRKANTVIGADRGIDTPAYLRKYAHDRGLIGKWFGQYTRPEDLMSVGGAGVQVYYARVRAIDAFGLNDAFVAHNVPAHTHRPGHQKWAPDSYILSRNPTILCHNYRIDGAPYVPSPSEAAGWRARGFHWVSVAIPGLANAGPYYSFLKRLDRALGPLPADSSP